MGRVFLIILNDVVNHCKATKIHLEMGISNHLRQNWGSFVIGVSHIRLRDSKKSSMIMIGLATLAAVYLLVSLPSCNQNMAVENPSFIDDFPIQPLFSSGIFQLAIFENPSEGITCPAVFPHFTFSSTTKPHKAFKGASVGVMVSRIRLGRIWRLQRLKKIGRHRWGFLAQSPYYM